MSASRKSLLTLTTCLFIAGGATFSCQPRTEWYRGNLHTHSYWSDGDQFPDVILSWYKDQGYDFVSMSDHNVLADTDRWVTVSRIRNGAEAFARYQRIFNEDWIETRQDSIGQLQVRLKRFEEYAERLGVQGEFLVLQGEEISDSFASRPLHVNATNVAEFIPPQGGTSVADVLQRNIDAVLEQRDATGQPMFPHVNHPNFGWAVTAEDLMNLRGEKFFEVYNGHPLVHNDGDSLRPSTERIWDIVLTHRLTTGQDVVYGIAVDDAHHYLQMDSARANPARGWVLVRAPTLSAEAIIRAMEGGDFYGTTGVVLDDVTISDSELAISIVPEPGVTYTTTFVGTRRGFDDHVVEVPDVEGLPVSGRYSDEIGTVLAEVAGSTPHYSFAGDEIYVRARIESSRAVENPVHAGEVESAWIQPVVLWSGSPS
jgi:hypothetical protein